jgi:hypothetical protein
MATVKKPIKKAQAGVKVDKTSVAKPKVRGTIKNEPKYIYADKVTTPTKKDSIDYKKGYDFGQRKPKDQLQGLFENPAWSVGNLEGRDDKRPKKKISMKTGGTVKAKDGKWMQKAAASIKKRDTEGKCTPITKPGCTGKAKTLAKTFKKIAKSNKKK